eukprot:9636736-Ditylum_brightwellii.AAC.1
MAHGILVGTDACEIKQSYFEASFLIICLRTIDVSLPSTPSQDATIGEKLTQVDERERILCHIDNGVCLLLPQVVDEVVTIKASIIVLECLEKDLDTVITMKVSQTVEG